MRTRNLRLEAAEAAVKRLPALDDLLRGYSNADWAGAFGKILGRPVAVVRGGAKGAMEAMTTSDLKSILAWLKDSPHERQGKD